MLLYKQLLAFRPSKMDFIFAVKTFIAGMLALYLAFCLDLTYPMWAIGTVTGSTSTSPASTTPVAAPATGTVPDTKADAPPHTTTQPAVTRAAQRLTEPAVPHRELTHCLFTRSLNGN